MCELIPVKITPFPAERLPWCCSCPGNTSELLHLGLCTFTTSNIAINLVVDFSTGLHTDRFEAAISVNPFLVFLPMHLCGHMEPPPEVFASVEQPSHPAADRLGARFLLYAMQKISVIQLLRVTKLVNVMDVSRMGKCHCRRLASLTLSVGWVSWFIAGFLRTPYSLLAVFFHNQLAFLSLDLALNTDILHENSCFCLEKMHRLFFSVGLYEGLFSWIVLVSEQESGVLGDWGIVLTHFLRITLVPSLTFCLQPLAAFWNWLQVLHWQSVNCRTRRGMSDATCFNIP